MERYKSIPRDVVNRLDIITYLILMSGHKVCWPEELCQRSLRVRLALIPYTYGPANLPITENKIPKIET